MEHDPPVRAALSARLGECRLRAGVCDNGLDALYAADAARPDVLLRRSRRLARGRYRPLTRVDAAGNAGA